MLNDFLDETNRFLYSTGMVGAVVLTGVGVFFGLFGYRFHQFLLFVSGFILGAAIGVAVGAIAEMGEATVLAAILLGVVAGFVSVALEKIAVFLLGFLVGAILGGSLGAIEGVSSAALILMPILGIMGGIVALKVHIFVIIFASSAGGAFAISGGLGSILIADVSIQILLIVVLTIVFMVFQYRNLNQSESSANLETALGGRGRQVEYVAPVVSVQGASWDCPQCGTANKRLDVACRNCGNYR